MGNERRKSLMTSIFTNCAHPRGTMGRVMLTMMNYGHAPLTNWGLGHIPFQNGWTIPAILIVIDNYGSFHEKTGETYDAIMSQLVTFSPALVGCPSLS